MCTGGAVCIIFMLNGHSVGVSLFAAFIAGMIAGLLTGIFHTAMGDPGRDPRGNPRPRLGLYSINLRIMGGKQIRPSAWIRMIFLSLRYVKESLIRTRSSDSINHCDPDRVLYWFFSNGDRMLHPCHRLQPEYVTPSGINNIDFTKILGLMIPTGSLPCERLICPVSGLCRCQCRPWRHRDRSRSRYHR